MDEMGETTDDPSTLSMAGRRNSFELAEVIRRQVRQQVIQEFLEACGDDEGKRDIVRELAEKVVSNGGGNDALMGTVASFKNEGSESDDDDDDDDDSEESGDNDKNKYKWADVESIDEIEDSPYEAGASAEVGEVVFEKFKALLMPEETSTSRRRGSPGVLRPTKKAIEKLGSRRAEAMVTANFHAAQSGILYSPLWLEGKIRDVHIEGLTAPMLLLCLQEQRFSRAEIKGVLNKLVEDLRLASIVQEALDDWNLEGQFPNLTAVREAVFPYNRNHKTECQKSEIFVARAFACMNFLKRKSIKGGIAKKVLACLRIMEQHLEVETSTSPNYPTHIQVPTTPQAVGDGDQEEEESSPSRASLSPPHQPSPHSREVEKLDLVTGQVLGTYPSHKAGAASVGKNIRGGISDTIHGRKRSAGGFFWRYVGSNDLPQGLNESDDDSQSGASSSEEKSRLPHIPAEQARSTAGSINLPPREVIEKSKSSPKARQSRLQEAASTEEQKETGTRTSSSTKSIEKVDMETGRVLASYASVSEANLSMGRNPGCSNIRKALSGEYKSTGGFFWRVSASTEPTGTAKDIHSSLLPEKDTAHERHSKTPDPARLLPVPVEKLDLHTGEVLGSFPSIGRASASQGVDSKSIRQVLAGKSKFCGGVFWRRAGSNNLPAGLKIRDENKQKKKSPRANQVPVEKLDPETGNILEWYPSISVANVSIGKDPNHSGITETLAGRQGRSSGFLWRRADANLSSQHGKVSRSDSNDLEMTESNPKPRKTNLTDGHNNSSSRQSASPRKRPSDQSKETHAHPLKKVRQGGVLSETSEEGNGDSQKASLQVLPEPLFDLNQMATISGGNNENSSGHASMRKILAMNDIVDSPYQENATAEVGEEMFEFYKSLLIPKAGVGRKQVGASDLAIKVFGGALAQTVIDANSKIAISGMVYSTEWSEGLIRGAYVGSMPKPVLLLLLQEQRFSRPGVLDALLKIVTDFDLCRVMTKALVEWKLTERFSKISQVTTHSLFTTRQPHCYKCLVFVARVYHCMGIFRLTTMTDSIQRKVEACLQILEANFGHRPPRKQDVAGIFIDQAASFNDDGSSDDEVFKEAPQPKDITKSSHVLFQQTIPPARLEKKAKPLGGPPKPSVAGPSQDKSGVTTGPPLQRRVGMKMAPKVPLVHPHAPNEENKAAAKEPDDDPWFPYDSNREVVLTPIEVETAWLVEEGIYCQRNREINWRFVYKYASPALRVELRKNSVDQLERIVRLQDSIVADRFGQLRKEIRRSLLKGSIREKMKEKIPKERLASRQMKESTNQVPQQRVSQVQQPPQQQH